MSNTQKPDEASFEEVMQRKRHKARHYAAHPERFCVLAITLRLQAEHGLRQISSDGLRWHCTCAFFQEHETCSHTMAAEHLLMGLSLCSSQQDSK